MFIMISDLPMVIESRESASLLRFLLVTPAEEDERKAGETEHLRL